MWGAELFGQMESITDRAGGLNLIGSTSRIDFPNRMRSYGRHSKPHRASVSRHPHRASRIAPPASHPNRAMPRCVDGPAGLCRTKRSRMLSPADPVLNFLQIRLFAAAKNPFSFGGFDERLHAGPEL